MKIKSAMVTEASGSIGGFVASHNRGGLYLRARTVPVNPNSPQQQVIRSVFAQLSNHWLNTLTAEQREGWDTYALQVPLPDRLGEPRNVGGLAMYIRSNSPRLQVGANRVDDAPGVFNLGEFSLPSAAIPDVVAQTVDVSFGALDAWVSEDTAAMILFGSRPQNESINFFKGPYRTMPGIAGDSGAPPASPHTAALPFVYAAGQVLHMRANVYRADGRLGTEVFFRSSPIPVAATRQAPGEPLNGKRRKLKK